MFYGEEKRKKIEDNFNMKKLLGILVLCLFLGALTSCDYLEKRKSAKEFCGQSYKVANAKTDAAAKLAYKSCMSEYMD